MDATCEFFQQYLPAKTERDGVLVHHVRNCPECLEQAPELDLAG